MRIPFLCVLALWLTLVPACAASPKAAAFPSPTGFATVEATAARFPLTVTDDAARSVVVSRLPERIVSLSASNTEILYALGLGDRVVGVDDYSNYPASVKDKPRVGGFSNPDLEKIVVLSPDLVVGTGMHVKTVLAELERRKLTVLIVDPRDVSSVMDKITLVGTATGQGASVSLAGDMRKRIEAVETRLKGVEPVRVFFELDPQLHTVGPGSFVDDMIRTAGGVNIAADAGREWPQLSQEALLMKDPQVIVLSDHGSAGGQSPESVAARPGWQQLSAVKSKRIHALEPDLINRAGPRVVDGLELLAGTFHPDKMK